MIVGCARNLVNIYVFLRFYIFDLFDILGSSGTAWDLILAAFQVPGAAFSWSGRVLAGCAGWLAGWGGPRI